MARKPEWKQTLDRQMMAAMAVVERMLQHRDSCDPEVLAQLVSYVLGTAHGDNLPYTVRELDELLRIAVGRGTIGRAVEAAVREHMGAVEVL